MIVWDRWMRLEVVKPASSSIPETGEFGGSPCSIALTQFFHNWHYWNYHCFIIHSAMSTIQGTTEDQIAKLRKTFAASLSGKVAQNVVAHSTFPDCTLNREVLQKYGSYFRRATGRLGSHEPKIQWSLLAFCFVEHAESGNHGKNESKAVRVFTELAILLGQVQPLRCIYDGHDPRKR